MIKKILKWIAWISACLVLLFLIAYWTSPYWVPGQLAKFLPQTIQLESLDLERPGLTRTKVKQLSLRIEGDTQLDLELHNTELKYSLWQQKLLSVSAEKAIIQMSPSKQSASDTAFQLPKTITIPQLPINQLSIEQVQIKGLAGQSIELSDITFNANQQQIELGLDAGWMGLTAKVDAKIEHQQQQLTSIKLDVKQDSNELVINARPLGDSRWQLELSGEIQQIPFIQLYSADLGSITFDLASTIQQTAAQQYNVRLQKNSKLQIPLRFNPAWFDQEVASYAKEYGLTLNTGQIDKQALLTLMNSEETVVDLNLATKLLKADGLLQLTASNNNLKSTVTINNAQLDLSKTLTEPTQQLSALITARLSLPGTSYQSADQSLNFKTDALSTDLKGSVNLLDGNLLLKSQQLSLELAKSTLKGNAYTVNLPSHHWQGSVDWAQNFTQALSSSSPDSSQSQPSTVAGKKLNFNLAKPIDVKVALTDETINANQLTARVNLTNGIFTANYSANQLALVNQPLTLYDIKGTLKPDPTNAAVNGDLSFIQASYLSDNIAVDYVSGKFNWKLLKQTLTAKGALQHSQSTIPVRYVYNLKTGDHDLQIDRSSLSMLTLKSWTPLLNAYPALQVTGGDLNIKKIQGDPLKLLFEGALSVDNLSLLYDKLALNNATITDNLSKQSPLQGSVTANINSIQLAAGIAITNLNLKLEHTAEHFRFEDINGQLLGGTVKIPRFDMHKTAIKPFTLLLSDIDLQSLLTALESEKLSVSSKFDLTLPLIINPDSRQIINGTFISKKPGILKLKSDGGKEANIAFQALEDFHYKELSGTIDYSSEGDYIITLYTLGSNPDVYNGFPIKLDLTLRGNLPNLLYSMLITGDMATPVLDDLKQKQLLKIQ